MSQVASSRHLGQGTFTSKLLRNLIYQLSFARTEVILAMSGISFVFRPNWASRNKSICQCFTLFGKIVHELVIVLHCLLQIANEIPFLIFQHLDIAIISLTQVNRVSSSVFTIISYSEQVILEIGEFPSFSILLIHVSLSCLLTHPHESVCSLNVIDIVHVVHFFQHRVTAHYVGHHPVLSLVFNSLLCFLSSLLIQLPLPI